VDMIIKGVDKAMELNLTPLLPEIIQKFEDFI